MQGHCVMAFEDSCIVLSDQDVKVVAALSHGQEPFSKLHLIVL